MNKNRVAGWLVAAMMTFTATAVMGRAPEKNWQVFLSGFFKGGTKPLYLYARERWSVANPNMVAVVWSCGWVWKTGS